MREKEVKIVEKFKQLVAERVKVHEVRVFGSRARGDASEESDLDVLVVVDKLDHSIDRFISECAWEAGFPDDIVVMPIVITQEALRHSPLSESAFIRTVYQESVCV